jgi:hypothetical protein
VFYGKSQLIVHQEDVQSELGFKPLPNLKLRAGERLVPAT